MARNGIPREIVVEKVALLARRTEQLRESGGGVAQHPWGGYTLEIVHESAAGREQEGCDDEQADDMPSRRRLVVFSLGMFARSRLCEALDGTAADKATVGVGDYDDVVTLAELVCNYRSSIFNVGLETEIDIAGRRGVRYRSGCDAVSSLE